ncbi:fimbria/pilus outer membrane usher protein [Serratia microhaemolytica]|uniref:fimbria/pilus outer membrane usher protein n=1 Tax=Serratia microhaemolytica TaxID=2675110 RepID=UPI000FDE290E|nr:fimbria/pilus outer membrane usher protein [Serratia microhaemolytica]
MKISFSPRQRISLRGHFLRQSLSCCLLLALAPAWAEDYFDPSFLRDPGVKRAVKPNVDLSPFALPGGIAPGEYTVTVFVNNRTAGQYTLNFQKNSQGKIAPGLTPAQLEKWGVNVAQLPEFKELSEQSIIDDLAALIPQATTSIDLPRLRLDVSVPQIAMRTELRGVVDPSQWDDGISAAMMSYNISASHNNNNQQERTNTNLFANVRAGINVGPWRLRSSITHAHINYSGKNAQSDSVTTRVSNTYLYRDIAKLRSSLLVGESNTSGDIFDGFYFRGVKLNSNEQMLPSQLRGYSPAISGIANSNARITVRQNGNIMYETYVAPGPFNINSLPQSGLSGNYDVTITEADGTERRFVVPYSSLPVMLRPGAWKYEVVTGRYSGNITSQSRQALFAMGSGIYGLSNGVTVYGGLLGSNDYQAINLGFGISLSHFGALSADVTHSIAKFEDETAKSGQSYRIRYSKSMLASGTSIDLTALRYSTRDFYNFNEFNGKNFELTAGAAPWSLQRRRSSFQTQISQQLGRWGSVSLRATRDDFWASEQKLTGLALGYNNSFKGVSYSVNYSIDQIKDRNGNWPENRQLSLNVSIPLSVFGYAQYLQSVYATASATRDSSGQTSYQTGISGGLLDGRASYSASQSWGNQDQATSNSFNIGYQGSRGSLSTGYSHSHVAQSVNINLSGGLVLHSGGVTLTRSLGESIAVVRVPGAAGVEVSNELTDWRGYAVIPYLSDYMRNNIAIDPSSLPEGTDVAHTNTTVIPTQGAVVAANFATRIGYQVLMTLQHGNGVVPFGAIAALADAVTGEENASIVGDAGQVYMTGLPESGTLLVKWGESVSRQCWVNFDIAKIATSPDKPLRQATYRCDVKVPFAADEISRGIVLPERPAKPVMQHISN